MTPIGENKILRMKSKTESYSILRKHPSIFFDQILGKNKRSKSVKTDSFQFFLCKFQKCLPFLCLPIFFRAQLINLKSGNNTFFDQKKILLKNQMLSFSPLRIFFVLLSFLRQKYGYSNYTFLFLDEKKKRIEFKMQLGNNFGPHPVPFFVKEKDTRNFQKTKKLHNKCHGTKEKKI